MTFTVCSHTDLKTPFCPTCGEANTKTTPHRTLLTLLNRAVSTGIANIAKHKEWEGNNTESGAVYHAKMIQKAEAKLDKLNEAREWLNDQPVPGD